jgi:dTMP kinase
MTGIYLAFEGIEGTGKSTIVRMLAERLEAAGRRVMVVREPGGTPTGERIREALLHGEDVEPWAEALLFAAQRSQLASEVIRPALAAGAYVLGDRSVYSSLAYQGFARELGIEAVRAVNESGLGGTWPNKVLWLNLDPAEGLQRQSDPDRIGGEGVGFQHRVAEGFALLAAREPRRFIEISVAGRSLDEVLESCWLEVQRCM